MGTLGARLRQERQRLGFTQEDFAVTGGVKRGAQVAYEQDKRSPDGAYLQAMATLGVDVQFVVTGVRSSQALSVEEEQVLMGFRNLDLMGKARVLGVIEGAAPKESPRTVMTIKGNVGHQIHGDVHGTIQGVDMRKKVVKKK